MGLKRQRVREDGEYVSSDKIMDSLNTVDIGIVVLKIQTEKMELIYINDMAEKLLIKPEMSGDMKNLELEK
jgi:hypothetical protein